VSELPSGWAATSIGDLCELINGRAFKPEDWGDKGLPIVRIQNLNRPKSKFNFYAGEVRDRFLIDDQELLFAWSGTPGTSFGAHIWNGGKAVLNQHIFKILFNSDLIDRVFLKHAINQTLEEQIGKAHGGVGLRHVTKGKFEDTELGLPPLPEQRRIVAKVDGLTARTARARGELNRIPTLIARYKQRLLALAFSGELTAGWRKEIGGKESAYTKTKIETPFVYEMKGSSSWRVETIGSVCKIEGGSQPPKSTFIYEERPDYIRLIQIRDYKSDKHIVYIPKALARRFCSKTDIMIGRYGPPIFQILRGLEGSYNVALMKAVPIPSKISSEFLFWFLKHPTLFDYVELDSKRTAGQDGVNRDHLEKFPVPLPPLEEQAEIVRRIESAFGWLDRMAADHAAAARLLPKLDAAILSKAFRGELVPQDPNDEPASVLLDRIKAEREAAPKKIARKAAATTGAVVGAAIGGPVGALIGSAVGTYLVTQSPKRRGGTGMTKSRQDDDVMGKPYLAGLLKSAPRADVQSLFRAADLAVADFYKQLAWEIGAKHIIDDPKELKAA
jgi:type I restriction enzyme, S subunit